MAVPRTTSTFRPDDGGGGGGEDGRGLRRYHSQIRIGGRRPSKRSPSTEGTSVTAKQAGSSKVLLIGAVLAMQFVGAAASMQFSNRGNDIRVHFNMSQEAVVNSSINLTCEWILRGGSRLYSVKLFKEDNEFFKYTPDDEKTLIFDVAGVTIKEREEKGPKRHSQKSITLQNVTLASAGQYKCEVSTEAPTFAINYQTVNLTVISPPEKGPEITGLSTHYVTGENITANCNAWPSVPKANLRWTINDEPVRRENTVQNKPLPPIGTDGIPNSLGLWLEIEERHFIDSGAITVKCIAEVGSHKYDAQKRATMAHVNRQRLSASGDHSAARIVRAGLLAPLAVLALVLLAT